MHRLTARRLVPLVAVALAASLLSVVGAPSARAMCVPGKLTLLPKPAVELPRCEVHP